MAGRSGPSGRCSSRSLGLPGAARKAPPKGTPGFTPLWPLYKVEHTIAQLGRWRRLSRCYEGSAASARAWLEVASVGYLAWRVVA